MSSLPDSKNIDYTCEGTLKHLTKFNATYVAAQLLDEHKEWVLKLYHELSKEYT